MGEMATISKQYDSNSKLTECDRRLLSAKYASSLYLRERERILKSPPAIHVSSAKTVMAPGLARALQAHTIWYSYAWATKRLCMTYGLESQWAGLLNRWTLASLPGFVAWSWGHWGTSIMATLRTKSLDGSGIISEDRPVRIYPVQGFTVIFISSIVFPAMYDKSITRRE